MENYCNRSLYYLPVEIITLIIKFIPQYGRLPLIFTTRLLKQLCLVYSKNITTAESLEAVRRAGDVILLFESNYKVEGGVNW